MKKGIRKILSVFMALVLILQTAAFAAANTNVSNNLTFVGADKMGYEVNVDGGRTTAATLLLKGADNVNRVAYCVDAMKTIVNGHKYSILNLEDSGHMSQLAAKKIRAVIQNSYPAISLEEIRSRFGKWISNEEEAITATQLAIWKLSNNKDFTPNIFLNKGREERIIALENWYLRLPALSGRTDIADIEIKSSTVNGEMDIAYRASEPNEDNTPVSLTCKMSSSFNVENKGMGSDGYYHTIVKNPTEYVSVSIEGNQKVKSDVYLFEPEGGRDGAQTMAGMSSGEAALKEVMTLKYEKPPVEDGGIRIKKTDSATGLAIPNVEFLISQDMSFSQSAHTITTDSNGMAEKMGLPSGTWYIKEVSAPEKYMVIDEIMSVSVGKGVYDLAIKNTPYSGLKILKTDDDNIPVVGAKFSIYSGAEAVGEPLYKDVSTDGQGIILKDKLTAGKYTIVETYTPPQYRQDTTPITVDVLVGKTREVKIVNVLLKGTMHIYKYDAITREQLMGAKFTVYSDKELKNKVGNVDSLKDGPSVIESLKPGTYYVQETKAPDGYLTDPNVQIAEIKGDMTTQVKFYNSKGIPTAGNYGTILFAGAGILAVCALGWVGLMLYNKKAKSR